MSGGSSRRYPPELRDRAVRMVAEISGQHGSEWAAISEVARLLGVGCAERYLVGLHSSAAVMTPATEHVVQA
jgi:transposase-like protein